MHLCGKFVANFHDLELDCLIVWSWKLNKSFSCHFHGEVYLVNKSSEVWYSVGVDDKSSQKRSKKLTKHLCAILGAYAMDYQCLHQKQNVWFYVLSFECCRNNWWIHSRTYAITFQNTVKLIGCNYYIDLYKHNSAAIKMLLHVLIPSVLL